MFLCKTRGTFNVMDCFHCSYDNFRHQLRIFFLVYRTASWIPLITEYWGPDLRMRMILAATLYFLHQDKDTQTFYTLSPVFTSSRLQPQLRAMFCDSGSDTSKKMRTRNLPGPSLKVKGFCESKTVSIVQESICELGGFWDRFLSSILVSAWINWLRLRFQTIRSRYHW